jgi:hypothetical protein
MHGKVVRESHVSKKSISVSAYSPPKSHVRSGAVIISKTNRTDWVLKMGARLDQPPINQAAIALLRSWRNEDPERHRQDWEALKQAIDEDRPSERELFP